MFEIRERLRPFSHLPGCRCYIPGTQIEVVAYPTRIVVDGKVTECPKPGKNFTSFLDLERRCVTITSDLDTYHVWSDGSVRPNAPQKVGCERLFLGSHKKQEWERMRARCDMRELFPIWFQLGQMVKGEGRFSLFEKVSAAPPDRVIDAFTDLFLVGFRDLFIPQKSDAHFQGITDEEVEGDPLILLSEGARLIRALFVDGEKILPKLPPQFPAGKLCALQMPYGVLSIEWTKKQIRRLSLKAQREGILDLSFPRAIKNFRVNKRAATMPFEVEAGKHYLFDRFQK